MKNTKISRQLARRLVLHAQLLDSIINLPEGKEGVAQTIETLGYIQIDTIAVIQRAHHHTLWTRQPGYYLEMLHELQVKDRSVFEYWGHAMSYLPISAYRYFLPKMRNFENPKSKWAQYCLEKCSDIMPSILERIQKEGPLSSKDFSPPPGRKGGTWWDWKPSKLALEMLFWKGDLMITERRNFQKVYDLTERVLPESIDTAFPDNDELGQFFVRRALSAYGVALEKEIRNFMQPETGRDSDIQAAGSETIAKLLGDLMEAGEVIPVEIENNENTTYYALAKTIEQHDSLKQLSSVVFLLSPFDNLIIQRQRTKRLFDFDYALECYVPAPKRKYGYFVLPILWGENFIGRLDPKADRKKKTMIVRNLIFEPYFEKFEDLLPLLANKLVAFARFNQCEKIVFEKVSPPKIRVTLKRLVKAAN